MAAHPSILAWSIPWTEEPGGLRAVGCGERLSVYRAGRHTPGLRIIKGSGRQAPLMGIFQASSSYFPKQVIKAGQVSPKGRLDSGDIQSIPLISRAELGEGA